jgi:multisubunit Na+/H+ antiporter MnhB subunit
MNSLILRTATRVLVVLLFLVSLALLIRGHNEPGGGFIGALVASAAVALSLLAFGSSGLSRRLAFPPRRLLGAGLGLALLSGLFALVQGAPLMEGRWAELSLGAGPSLKLGTPLLFDIGVYLTVFGFAATIIRSLEEAEE